VWFFYNHYATFLIIMKKVLIFGSSGSIGRSTLEIIRKDRRSFRVLGLMVNKNVKKLIGQAKEFIPKYVCIVDKAQAKKAMGYLPRGVKLLYGKKGVEEFSSLRADVSVMGIVGISSLRPLLTAMKHSKEIALASKEALVTAGELIMRKLKLYRAKIIPVDSEINALFQLFSCIRRDQLKKIYLTASGGPLFDYSTAEIRKASKEIVLSHPTWRMGKRITVDSATLVNKGFEVIESHHLFGIDYKNIDIVIHRESYIHAMIESKDNMLFSLMYEPSMMMPISFSLYYPKRSFPLKGFGTSFISLKLSFDKVNYAKFPLLKIVIEAAKKGGNFPIVINAADEVAVEYFLKGRAKFYDIQRAVKYMFSKTKKAAVWDLNSIYFWDNWARIKTEEFLDKICG